MAPPTFKQPPSDRFRNYRPPSDAEHKVFEQYASVCSTRISKLVVFLTGLATFIACLAAFFAYKSWQAAERQADDGYKILTETQRQANAATQTLELTKEANRPYLFKLTPSFTTINNEISVKFNLKNFGVSPAIITRAKIATLANETFDHLDATYESRMNLTPSSPIIEPVISANNTGNAFLQDLYSEPGYPKYIFGEVLYQDFRGGRYSLVFCYSILSEGAEPKESGGKHCMNRRT